MIARVTLELAIGREFDYLIPPELLGSVDVGSRVQVPFGPRKVLGCVTAVAEESAHPRLKSIIRLIGAQTLVTPKERSRRATFIPGGGSLTSRG